MELEDFFTENRERIFKALPHGTISMLIKPLGVGQNLQVRRIFEFGKTPQHFRKACRHSMLCIEAAETDPELVKMYKQTFTEHERSVVRV